MSAWVLHWYIERPLIGALRRQFKMKPPVAVGESLPRGDMGWSKANEL